MTPKESRSTPAVKSCRRRHGPKLILDTLAFNKFFLRHRDEIFLHHQICFDHFSV